MKLSIKDSGKGNVSDVTGEYPYGTGVIVDIVAVNQAQVWRRYSFEINVSVAANKAISFGLTGHPTVKLVEITGGISVDLGDTTNIPTATTSKKYKIIQDKTLTGFKFIGDGITDIDVFSFGGVTDISDFAKGMTTLATLEVRGGSNVENITTIASAFEGCTSLVETPRMETRLCSNFSRTFKGCTSIHTVRKISFGPSSNGESMFEGCTSITQFEVLDFGNVSNAKRFFANAKLPAGLNLGFGGASTLEEMLIGTNVSTMSISTGRSLTNLNKMAFNNTILTRLEMYGFGSTTAVDSFNGCTNASVSLANILVTNGLRAFKDSGSSSAVRWDILANGEEMYMNSRLGTSGINASMLPVCVNMKNMFNGSNAQFGATVNELNFPEATDATNAFKGCQFQRIDSITMPKVEKLDGFLQNNTRLTVVGDFITSTKLKSCSHMLDGSVGIPMAPKSMITASVTDFSGMFKGCSLLDVFHRAYDTKSGTNFDSMFEGCSTLRCMDKINTSKAGATKVDMFKDCTALIGTTTNMPDAAARTLITSTAGKNWVNPATC